MSTITSFIYRCTAKADMYLYLRQRDDFSCLPDELGKRLGRLDFAMKIELDEQKKLARENTITVINNLKKQGFHLQMPGDTAIDDILARIAAEQNAISENSPPVK
jgi:uncharacterized protein YcgL (UPF0745 family)